MQLLGRKLEFGFAFIPHIGHQGSHNVNKGIVHAAMARVTDLANVLELLAHAFDQHAFAQQHFIDKRHQLVFHSVLALGDELHALLVQLLEERLADIAPIAEQLAPQAVG